VVDSFLLYLYELKRWNERVCNLTSLKNDEDIIVKHFFDSLLYLKVIPAGRLRIVDIGSGAGFPGFPIKLLRPDYSLTAIEARGKKCSFMRHMVRKLKLKDVAVVNKRVEEVTELSAFGVAVTRAVFSLKEFIEKGERLLKENGVLIISEGPNAWKEISTIHDRSCDVTPLPLPFSSIIRYLVTIKKA
jgi:16S rRNA (guanine527-N7)-methyltransferase